MYCRICGNKITENQRFCPNCGAPTNNTPGTSASLGAGHGPNPSAGQKPSPNADQEPNPNAGHGPNPSAGQIPNPSAGQIPNPNMQWNPTTPGNPATRRNPNIPPYQAGNIPRKKENKVLVAVLIGILALFTIAGLVSVVKKNYDNWKSYYSENDRDDEGNGYANEADDAKDDTDDAKDNNDNKDNSNNAGKSNNKESGEDSKGDEEGDNASEAQENNEDKNNNDEEIAAAVISDEAPFYFKNEKWLIPVEGAFVNASGSVNTDYLGERMVITQTTDLGKAFIITSDGFRYIDEDTADIDFAPNAQCADIAPHGSDVFYVIPTGTKENVDLGELHVFNTDNGKDVLVSKDIVRDSPVIAPKGDIVAYSKYYGGDDIKMYVGGREHEEELIVEGTVFPLCVSDEKLIYYIDSTDYTVYKYDGKPVKLFNCGAARNCFINTTCDEILFSGSEGIYYCNKDLSKASCLYSGDKISGVFTDFIVQPYGQIANTSFCDVKSLKDIVFLIDGDKKAFVIDTEGKGAIELPCDFSKCTNLMISFDNEKRTVMYSHSGKLYKMELDDGKAEEKVFYENATVDSFVSSYDLNNIWIISGREVYYLKDNETTRVANEISTEADPLGNNIMWNAEDNYLYYVKNRQLYKVFDKESSGKLVSEDADILTNIYGKLYYLPKDRASVYLFTDGTFKKIL